MPNQYFRFKQFAIRQENVAMKVGTDGVLLGAWTNLESASRILDVGTGTGLIAIMMAQRSKAAIDAVEIDEASCTQARENVERCPWSDRISIYHQTFQSFAHGQENLYDLIVSNPPYFIKSLKSPDLARAAARHTDELPQDELIDGVTKLLHESGRFSAIFPYVEGNIFVAKAAANGLFCCRRVNVVGKQGAGVKRLLLEFSKEKLPLDESDLTIRDTDDAFTIDYQLLTKDFYLAF